ncbi:MAG: hypothetical protein V6Z81_03655 [Parvularculales bacterium]
MNIIRIMTATFAMALLAACGGGTSGVRAPVVPDAMVTGDNIVIEDGQLGSFANLSQDGDNALSAARLAANGNALAAPSGVEGGDAGSVTMSSGTTAVATATVNIPASGTTTYELDIAGGTFLDTGNTYDKAIKTRLPAGADTFEEVILLHDDGDGDRTAILAHNRENNATVQYIAWGIWAEVPDAGTATYGAFADSTSGLVYNQDNLPSVTGTATYNGHAVGAALVPGQSTNPFVADVRIVADFKVASNTDFGNVEGTVDNFRFQRGAAPVTSVDLEMVNIRTSGGNSGYSQGTTSAMTTGATPVALTGEWTSRFYGTEGGSTQPASIGGTFGVQAANNLALLGAFAADR